jgi:hypothetical protein
MIATTPSVSSAMSTSTTIIGTARCQIVRLIARRCSAAGAGAISASRGFPVGAIGHFSSYGCAGPTVHRHR